jgi:hypothetical protein
MRTGLILILSLFGLAMGLATVFWIPSTVEPAFWLPIFVWCAYIIACRTGQRFWTGVLLGLANSVWITASHILFFSQYVAGHAREAEMLKSMPWPDSPRLMMALTGPLVGIVSGVVIGVFAVIAGKFLKAPRAPASQP